jgi:Na+/alanine symporter
MIKTDFLKRISLSVTDRNFGKTVVSESLGTALKYFWLFILLVGVITTAVSAYSLYYDMKELAQIFQQEAPEFRLENGTFVCQGKMPIVKKSDGTVIIIDTTGKTNETVLEKYDDGVFISSTKIVRKNDSFNSRTIFFKDFTWLNFTKQDMIRFINKWLTPIVSIFALIFFGVGKLINIFLVSLMGLIVNAFMQAKLLYANILKLSIYAITLPTAIKAILDIFDMRIPYFSLIYYIIAIFYIYRYLSEIRKELQLTSVAEKLPGDIQ